MKLFRWGKRRAGEVTAPPWPPAPSPYAHGPLKLPQITYKDGWEVNIQRIGPTRVEIVVRAEAIPDAYHEGSTTLLRQDVQLDLKCINDEHLASTIRSLVHLLENHEADEWLKIDGNRVVDPHPNGRPGFVDATFQCNVLTKGAS